MSGTEPPGREGRLPARIAVYAAGLSVFLIAVYVVTLSFRTQPGTQPGADTEASAKPPEIEPTVAFAMLDAKDGSGFGEDPSYSDSFRALRAKPAAAQGGRPLNHEAVRATPAQFRGLPVTARGVIVDLRSVRLKNPADGELDVFRGFITDTDGTRPVVFDLVAPPDVMVQAKRDALDVEGVFYRMVTYETARGVTATVPYLLATSVRLIGPAPPWHGLPKWLAATIGLSAGGAIAFVTWRRARTKTIPRTTAGALRREAMRLRAQAGTPSASNTPKS